MFLMGVRPARGVFPPHVMSCDLIVRFVFGLAMFATSMVALSNCVRMLIIGDVSHALMYFFICFVTAVVSTHVLRSGLSTLESYLRAGWREPDWREPDFVIV